MTTAEQVAAWANSPQGQAEIKETAEKIAQMQRDNEQRARDEAVWWAENKHIPMTI